MYGGDECCRAGTKPVASKKNGIVQDISHRRYTRTYNIICTPVGWGLIRFASWVSQNGLPIFSLSRLLNGKKKAFRSVFFFCTEVSNTYYKIFKKKVLIVWNVIYIYVSPFNRRTIVKLIWLYNIHYRHRRQIRCRNELKKKKKKRHFFSPKVPLITFIKCSVFNNSKEYDSFILTISISPTRVSYI